MRSRPLSLAAELAQAAHEGRKTETRRPVGPGCGIVDGQSGGAAAWEGLDLSGAWVDPGPSPVGNAGPYLKVPRLDRGSTHRVYPPWGPGDLLYVREPTVCLGVLELQRQMEVRYLGDGSVRVVPWPERIKRPAFGKGLANGCYREASRTWLRVVSVDVERVQDITGHACLREGIERAHVKLDESVESVRMRFRALWDRLYERRGLGWDVSPWVWVVRWERVEVPDAV